MNLPVNLFIATSVVVLLFHRFVTIVRESVAEARPVASGGASSIADAALRAAGRILVLFGTALAISFVVALTEHAMHAAPLATSNAPG